MEAIESFLGRLKDILEQDGVSFFSFKQNIPDGVDNEGRYFTPSQKEIWVVFYKNIRRLHTHGLNDLTRCS